MAKTGETQTRPAELAAVTELYERWRSAWLNVDPKLMLSCFDAEFDGLIYQSEENADALFTYAELEKYWTMAPTLLEGVSKWDELRKRIVFLGEESAVIWTLLDTTLNLKTSPPQDLGGKLRCVLGLRKARGKWLIVHYNESRQFLITAVPNSTWSFGVEYTERVRQ